MFLGRTKELDSLERMYSKENFQMAVLYGRRRIGKTALLNEFSKSKKTLYLSAEEINDSLNLKKFSHTLGELLGINNFPSIPDWQTFFTIIVEQLGKERLVLIIDEYPYAASANRSLNSILQHIIDYQFSKSNIFLILCGSSMSFMENHVLGEKSPLFGRRTGQLKLNPFDYYDAAQFYPNASAECKIKYYAVFGGTPYYLSLIDKNMTFEENVKELYFEMNSYLLNEGVLLMRQEFRESANYNAVLQAIASGANTLSEIVGFTKLESNFVSRYLLTLQELNFIERIIPFNANSLKGKKSLYCIAENFIAFWYRYVFPVKGEIERGNGDIYFHLSLRNLSEYIGPIFETITLQYLRRENAAGKLPFTAKSFGKWWGKDKKGNVHEIDIVLESINPNELIIGECKWNNTMKWNKTVDTLIERGTIFDKYKQYLYLFTKAEMDEGNSAFENVTIVSIEKYYL